METIFAPNFLIFQMFIKWFIVTFSYTYYIIYIVGSIMLICLSCIWKSVSNGKNESAIAIGIFSLMVMGTLIGLGNDIDFSLATYLINN